MNLVRPTFSTALSVLLVGTPPFAETEKSVAGVSEAYVRLVLALGQHDADYVDAYYGPPVWKTQAEAEKKPLDAIANESAQLRKAVMQQRERGDELSKLRQEYLTRQLSALEARVQIVRDSG